MQFKAEPINRPREQVEKQLREAIVSSALKPGHRLPSETQLAKEFKVSRATVREALRALAADGLISKQRGAVGGSFVEAIDHKSLAAVLATSVDTVLRLGRVTHDEVGSVREILEVPAVRLAALHASKEQVAEMEEVLEAHSQLGADASDAGRRLDIKFHSLIAAASGNRVLSALFSAFVSVPGPRPEFDDVNGDPEVCLELRQQRRAILSAITAGDSGAAANAMATHLAYFHQVAQPHEHQAAQPHEQQRTSDLA